MQTNKFDSHSMTGDLVRVLVCPPHHAGWDRPEKLGAWRELGFHRLPRFDVAERQHDRLCRLLLESGAEVVCLPPSESHTLDAVYAHDAALATDEGIILMNPGKATRLAEPGAHASFCSKFGTPVFGEVHPPGTSEAGDMVWLDPKTLLIGHGYRTNQAGINQMRALLAQGSGCTLRAPAVWPGPVGLPASDVADEHA